MEWQRQERIRESQKWHDQMNREREEQQTEALAGYLRARPGKGESPGRVGCDSGYGGAFAKPQ